MTDRKDNNSITGVIAGIRLTGETAQISYLVPGAAESETLSSVAGAEVYDFPLVLAKRRDNGLWLFGREAVQAAAAGEAQRVDDLLARAGSSDSVTVGGEDLEGLPLLVLYLKKMISLLFMELKGVSSGADELAAIQIATDLETDLPEEVFAGLAAALRSGFRSLKRVEWCSFAECLHWYLEGQTAEQRTEEALAFSCDGSSLVSYRHEVNHHTRPFVAGVERLEEDALPAAPDTERDKTFLAIATKRLTEHPATAVYLLGEGFDEAWLADSLEYLCRGRRVFLGNNLFSRGAVLRMREKLCPSDSETQTVYLGPDRILANLGIRVRKRGESHYHALIDGGSPWREASARLEVILDKDPVIAIEVTPLSGSGARTELLELFGLPVRDRRTTRLSVSLEMFSVDRAKLSVVDLGFGDTAPSSGEHWERFIALDAHGGSGAPGDGHRMESGVITEPILCAGREARRPYFLPVLDRRVFSVEELCYLISKNDYLLTMEAFGTALPDWLSEECLLDPLADQLREFEKRRCSVAVYAGTILEYVRLFPDEELARIDKVLRDGDARDGTEKKLKIIEYLIREGRLMEAHDMVASFRREGLHPVALARLLYDEGVIYARLFHYEAAAACMEEAWDLSGDSEVKEAYLAALRLSMSEEEYISAIGDRPELSPESLTLERKIGETMDLFAAGPDNHLLGTLDVYLDTGNLRAFDEETSRAEEEILAVYRRAMG